MSSVASVGIRSITRHEYLGGDPTPLAGYGLLPPSTICRCNVHIVGGYYDRVWRFRAIVIDMSRYRLWLRRSELSSGVSIEERHLQSLSDAGDHEMRVIINLLGTWCEDAGARRDSKAGKESSTFPGTDK
jgi:hypothetical protein